MESPPQYPPTTTPLAPGGHVVRRVHTSAVPQARPRGDPHRPAPHPHTPLSLTSQTPHGHGPTGTRSAGRGCDIINPTLPLCLPYPRPSGPPHPPHNSFGGVEWRAPDSTIQIYPPPPLKYVGYQGTTCTLTSLAFIGSYSPTQTPPLPPGQPSHSHLPHPHIYLPAPPF